MISAEQVDDEFAAHGLAGEKSKQHIDFEIGFFGGSDAPYWLNNDTLCIPVGAGDQVEDIDLGIVHMRDVWIYYDQNDPQAKMKMADLCGLMRASTLRPFRAGFVDRTNRLRALNAALRGWTDVTPIEYEQMKQETK